MWSSNQQQQRTTCLELSVVVGVGREGGEDSRVTRWQININISAASRLRPEHGLLSSPLPPDLSCCTPPRPRNLGTAGSGLQTRVPPVRSGAGRCGLPEIWRLAVTYRAWQDRAGIVRSRKLQWAVGLGRARTVLLQRSVSSVQIWRQVAEPRGRSRAWLRATPATLIPVRGCQEAGTRRELELDTGADTADSWRGNSPDSWLLTATVLLSAFTWYRTWAGNMAHWDWLHWTTVTSHHRPAYS